MLKKQTVSELSNKKNIILNKQEQIHILFMIGQIAQISAQLRELCKNAGMSEYQYSDNEDAYTVADFEVELNNHLNE